jgi:hypothetical protein
MLAFCYPVHRAATGQGTLPDPHRTLGALDRAVTQDNIASTICVAEWTRTVRPPAVQKVAFVRSETARLGDSADATRRYPRTLLTKLKAVGY